MRSINLLDFLSPGDKIYSGGEVYEVAKTTNTDKLMEKNWVYRYSVQDDEVCGYDDGWSYSSKEEAMERLKKDYADDDSDFKTTEAFFSDCRAWRSTEDGLHIQYDVFNVESE